MSLVAEVAFVEVDENPEVPLDSTSNEITITDALTVPSSIETTVPGEVTMIQIATAGPQGPAGPAGSGEGGGPHTHDDIYYTQAELDTMFAEKAELSHGHAINDIAGLQAALDSKADAGTGGGGTDPHNHDGLYYTESEIDTMMNEKADWGHNHEIAGIVNLQYELDQKQPAGNYILQSTLDNALNTKADVSHAHAIGDVTNLQTTLNGKAASTHTHAIADVTNLQTSLDGKAASSHTHDDRYFTETESDARFVRTVNGSGPDAGGNVTVSGGGGGSDSWSYIIATVDTANSNATTPVNATGLSISNLPDGLYEVIGTIQCTSVATTNGPRVGITTSGTGASVVVGMVGSNGLNLSASVWPGSNQVPNFVASANAPTTGGNFVGTFIQGTIRATSMSGSVSITIVPEVAGEVRVKADSFIRYRRIGN